MSIALLIILLAIGTFSHASSLLLAKKFRTRSEHFRSRFWKLHCIVNGTIWFAIIGLLIVAQFLFPHIAYPVAMRIWGIALVCFGVILVARAYTLLGMQRAMGSRFFFPETSQQVLKSSLYRFLHNPMYDGFILIILGVGLWFGIKEDFYLAATLFALLNILLAFVENPMFALNPF